MAQQPVAFGATVTEDPWAWSENDLLSDEELNSVEQEYAELTLQMGMVGEWYNHRDLLPDECCDRAYCVRCGNTPREAEVRYAYAI